MRLPYLILPALGLLLALPAEAAPPRGAASCSGCHPRTATNGPVPSLNGQPADQIVAAMAERFGPHVVGADGALDRAAVAALVFGDSEEAKANLADLNKITHPAIQAEVEVRIAAHAGTDAVVVLDHPLLTPRSDLAAFVVVDVPPDEAVRRLVEFRGMSEDDARRRIDAWIVAYTAIRAAFPSFSIVSSSESETPRLRRDLERYRARLASCMESTRRDNR